MGAFGPTWISYRLLDGPLRGRAVFIGHSGPPLVAVGQRIAAGAPLIAIHGGSYGGPPGHVEIGWGLPGGPPPPPPGRHSRGAAAAAGGSFRGLLAPPARAGCPPRPPGGRPRP